MLVGIVVKYSENMKKIGQGVRELWLRVYAWGRVFQPGSRSKGFTNSKGSLNRSLVQNWVPERGPLELPQ
jgi:hypothetical protein